jgi:N-succinyl-L-ornithine transcarbamylase
MRHFIDFDDAGEPLKLVEEARKIKKDPLADRAGEGKVLGLVFFNSSLRTRMSTTRAAYNLGMQVITLNVTQDSWQIEMEDGAVMDRGTAEHIREAAAVMGLYVDILGVRSFPGLKDRESDYKEELINSFRNLSGRPIVNLESATVHPLQSLADLITIEELKTRDKPKIVLTWAPHVKALPQAVANSFGQWMLGVDADLHIAQPQGLELSGNFTKGAKIYHNQEEALEGADFVYVKNWSSFQNYGKTHQDRTWMMDLEKLKYTANARLMHCLPVRRNLVIADDALDSEHSVVLKQAENRIFAAQVVLREILKNL